MAEHLNGRTVENLILGGYAVVVDTGRCVDLKEDPTTLLKSYRRVVGEQVNSCEFTSNSLDQSGDFLDEIRGD